MASPFAFITVGNVRTVVAQAPLLYVSPTQINAILPSSVPVGQYEVYLTTTMNVSGTSLPYFSGVLPIKVTDGRFPRSHARAGAMDQPPFSSTTPPESPS